MKMKLFGKGYMIDKYSLDITKENWNLFQI